MSAKISSAVPVSAEKLLGRKVVQARAPMRINLRLGFRSTTSNNVIIGLNLRLETAM